MLAEAVRESAVFDGHRRARARRRWGSVGSAPDRTTEQRAADEHEYGHAKTHDSPWKLFFSRVV
jgi:hypothetical protein